MQKNTFDKIRSLFLHIQKTAGSSIVRIAQDHYHQSMISHGDCFAINHETLNEYDFLSGHFGFSFAEPLMKDRFTFTFLREPSERVLSFYFFCKRSNPGDYPIYKIAHETSLDDFLHLALDHSNVQRYIWNHQTWQLSYGWGNIHKMSIQNVTEDIILRLAIHNLSKFSYIGLTENFDYDIKILTNILCMTSFYDRIKVNSTPNRPRLHEISKSTKSLLYKINELDYELYERACTYYKQQLDTFNN